MSTMQDSIFLNGPHAPMRKEGAMQNLPVTGKIPEDLSGTLFRQSASPQFDPLDPTRYHWFEGDGMIFAITLRDGKAHLQNRYVLTEGLMAERAAGRALYASMINGGIPLPFDPGRPPIKNTGNTNVTVFAGKLLAFSEIDLPFELDKDTLETKGHFNFGSIQGAVTAHWKIDPQNGDLLFYGVNGPRIDWYRADNKGRLVEHYAFETGQFSLVHDFVVTPDYAVFFLNPTLFDHANMQAGKPGLVWAPEIPCRIAIMRRSDGKVTWIEAPDAFSNTHFLNAWQDGDTIVVDGNRAPYMGTPRSKLNEPTPRQWFQTARPWRWHLNVAAGSYSDEQTSDVNSEFPRMNDTYTGIQARYGYQAATKGPDFLEHFMFDHITKHDLKTGSVDFFNPGHGLTAPGEMVFVPRPNAKAEDDGWLVGPWWNAQEDTTEFVIVDAQNLSEGPVARIKLPYRMPLGFHGNWVAD